jgi:hypothetical protein
MNTTLRTLLAVSLVAFGGLCFFKGLPSSVTRDPATVVMPGAVASIGSTSDASPAAAGVKTRAIQDIRVGQRVLAKNPEISNLERRARREEPEFSNWLQLSLEMPKSDGSTLHIEMLRSEEWLRNQLGFVIGEVSSGERQGVSPPSVIPAATANANLAPPSPQTETLQPQSLVLLSPLRPIYCDIALATVAADAEGVELVGLTVDLDLPEMGACGTAVITGISTTPEIEQGDGQVVTATFRHPPSNTVLDVVFVDEGTNIDQQGLAEAEKPSPVRRGSPAPAGIADQRSPEAQTGQRSTRDLRSNSSAGSGDPRTTAGAASKPIGVTDNHLFWSEDRGEFIEIGRMDIGERVRTLFGETKILAQKLPRPGPPAEVYNLEVHEEHVYFVGDDGVLAHNNCEIAFGNRAHGLFEWADSIGAKHYGQWDRIGYNPNTFKMIDALLEMEDATKIHFSLAGLRPNDIGGILDNAFNARPIGGSLPSPAIRGTAAEMGLALNGIADMQFSHKVLFHDNGRILTAADFIREQLSSHLVRRADTREWALGILQRLQ